MTGPQRIDDEIIDRLSWKIVLFYVTPDPPADLIIVLIPDTVFRVAGLCYLFDIPPEFRKGGTSIMGQFSAYMRMAYGIPLIIDPNFFLLGHAVIGNNAICVGHGVGMTCQITYEAAIAGRSRFSNGITTGGITAREVPDG
ncbi:MAG: hypothetical protein MI753_13815 [Hyphomicrobiales bacterium]|nr:hypothetical protein [Hyphomicrobiales bacterium]